MMKVAKIAFLLVFALATQITFAQNKKMEAAAELGITAEQVTSLEEINKKYAKQAKEIKNNESLAKREKSKELKGLKKQKKEEMVKVLGEEKYADYQAYLASNRQGKRQELSAAMEELDLTEEQKQSWKAINTKYREQGKAVKEDASLSTEEKKAKGKEIRKAQNEEIKALLSTEQYEKYVAMRKERQKRQR